MPTIYEEVEALKTQVTDLQQDMNNMFTDIEALQVIALTENADLNNLGAGTYYIPSTVVSATILNKPTESTATAIIQTCCGGDLALLQRYFPADKSKSIFWERTYYGNAWGSWHVVDHTDSGWIDLPLASGISAHNSTSFPCKYRKIGNKVYVRGCVKGFTETEKVVATLPAGFRPVSSFYMQKATDGGKTDTFNVRTNGEIKRVNTTQTAQAVGNYHFIDTEFLVD